MRSIFLTEELYELHLVSSITDGALLRHMLKRYKEAVEHNFALGIELVILLGKDLS